MTAFRMVRASRERRRMAEMHAREGTDTREALRQALRQARDDLADIGRHHTRAIHALAGRVEYPPDEQADTGRRLTAALARIDAALAASSSRDTEREKGAIGTAGDAPTCCCTACSSASRELEALRDLAGRTARHLRTLPEQTEGRDVALAAELERAAAGSLAASQSPTAEEGEKTHG